MLQGNTLRTILAVAVAVAAGTVAVPPQIGVSPRPWGSRRPRRSTRTSSSSKERPPTSWGYTMQFMSASLGVDFAFCHVLPGKFEADDKPPKRTAREMMAMQAMINKESFRGQRQVTCYSCHRGSPRPVNMPPIEASPTPAPPAPPAAPPTGTPSTVDSIIEKYVTAVGGADAIGKVSTRVMKGIILAGGVSTNIDVITKAPNKRLTITHNAAIGHEGTADNITRANDNYTAFDGKSGWLGSSGKPARDMSTIESEAASIDAEFALPVRLKEIFPQLRRGRPEEVNGMQCDVLNGSGPGRPAVRLYFDTKTGLLIRLVRYADTVVGRVPTQIDYADYRAVGKVNFPSAGPWRATGWPLHDSDQRGVGERLRRRTRDSPSLRVM